MKTDSEDSAPLVVAQRSCGGFAQAVVAEGSLGSFAQAVAAEGHSEDSA